jgi:hypothetical protein
MPQPPAVHCSLTLGAATTEPLVETVNAATAVHDLLFAGIERVALRTDINMKIFAACRTGLYGVATTAGGGNGLVLGMDICFHKHVAPDHWYRHPITAEHRTSLGELSHHRREQLKK